MAKIAAEETEGLSPREVAAANALLSGATRSDAARAGGYSPTSGALRKGGPIMSAVQRALHRNGAYRRSHEVVRETLDATTTKFFPTLGRVERTCTCQECGEEFTPAATTVACPSCGSVKWTVKEHTEIPSREVVAHGERRLAAELVYRLTGDLAAGEEIPAKILGPVSVEVFVAQATPVPRNGGGIQVVTVQTGHNGGAN
jgi:DNA-directed RNA polymerase subunit RPC12/RpoP